MLLLWQARSQITLLSRERQDSTRWVGHQQGWSQPRPSIWERKYK
jgi:hypothetical protein